MPAMTAPAKPVLRLVCIMPRRIPFLPRWARTGAGDRKQYHRISLSRKLLSSFDSYALWMTFSRFIYTASFTKKSSVDGQADRRSAPH